MGQQIKDDKLLLAIGKRLQEIRKEKKLSQEDVFNDTGIHIARIETGRQNISISTLGALCNYYSTTLRDFFALIK